MMKRKTFAFASRDASASAALRKENQNQFYPVLFYTLLVAFDVANGHPSIQRVQL